MQNWGANQTYFNGGAEGEENNNSSMMMAAAPNTQAAAYPLDAASYLPQGTFGDDDPTGGKQDQPSFAYQPYPTQQQQQQQSQANGSSGQQLPSSDYSVPTAPGYSVDEDPNRMYGSDTFYQQLVNTQQQQQQDFNAAAAVAAVAMGRPPMVAPAYHSMPNGYYDFHLQAQRHMAAAGYGYVADTSAVVTPMVPPPVNPLPSFSKIAAAVMPRNSNASYPGSESHGIMGATSPPVKRPRGRPRKHPLPINHPHNMLAAPQASLVTPPDAMAAAISDSSALRLSEITAVDQTSRSEKALKLRKNLYSDAVIRELAKLDELEAAKPASDVAEEYRGFGGPFAFLESALLVQQSEDDQGDQQQHATRAAAADAIVSACRVHRQGVLLNNTSVWASLNPRVPVRDLAVARCHMAALLNDGTVYVYRHKTVPMVRTMIAQWERVEALGKVGVVSVRMASASLPHNWREIFHLSRRRELIDQLRETLRKDAEVAHVIQQQGEPTEEELAVFVQKSPNGILTLPYSRLDPDWLPDPAILASVDCNGIVRFCKCGGYYNYPMLVENSDPGFDPDQQLPDGDEQPAQQGGHYRIQRNPTAMDRTDKQAELSVVKKGTSERVKAHVVDVALGEVTLASLLGVSNAPELSMVLYAVAPDQELSAFVKGKGLYIRFKNFPTGPAKMHCGPLGHTGVVLLANGTVWQWGATENNNGRVAVSIAQVAGSLKGKAVVDLLATGADYFALTNDGVVHEWNARKCYATTNHNLYSLNGEALLDIPEPIEWTPHFKKTLISQSGRSIDTLPDYSKGRFSWFLKPPPAADASVAAATQQQQGTTGEFTKTGDSMETMTTAPGTAPSSDGETPDESSQPPLPRQHPPELNEVTEDALEQQRQQEIIARYCVNPTTQENMKVDRLFVCEGISFLLRPNRKGMTVELNDLTEWSVLSSSHAQLQGTPATRRHQEHNPCRCISWADAQAAAAVARQYGKPLLTNPIIVARYRLTTSGKQDQQLRSLLESMANEDPPNYRILTASNYLILATLRTADTNALHRMALTCRVPFLLVADDPQRYAEAIIGNAALLPSLPTDDDATSECGRSSVVPQSTTPAVSAVRQQGAPSRRGRGRVGRPRGSRAGTRATLSSRPETTAEDEIVGAAAGTRKRQRRYADDGDQWPQGFDEDYDEDDEPEIDDDAKLRRQGKRCSRRVANLEETPSSPVAKPSSPTSAATPEPDRFVLHPMPNFTGEQAAVNQ